MPRFLQEFSINEWHGAHLSPLHGLVTAVHAFHPPARGNTSSGSRPRLCFREYCIRRSQTALPPRRSPPCLKALAQPSDVEGRHATLTKQADHVRGRSQRGEGRHARVSSGHRSFHSRCGGSSASALPRSRPCLAARCLCNHSWASRRPISRANSRLPSATST